MILLLIYLLLCLFLYLFQERFIFFPEKLPSSYSFTFKNDFTEHFIKTVDNVQLNLLHFVTKEKSRGVVLYLHGNSKSLKYWGDYADFFLSLGYNFITYDYRGFGKSEGNISSQKQLFKDADKVYEWVESQYDNSQIIVDGYSFGSGVAAYLADKYHPKILILEAPYYKLSHIMRKRYSIFPSTLLKYKFPTDEFIKQCQMPVYIFHGDKDEQISIKNSFRLSRLIKLKDRLIVLKNQKHNDLMAHPQYQLEMKEILED